MTVTGISHGAVFGVFTLGMLWPRANKHVSNAFVFILMNYLIYYFVYLGCSMGCYC